MKKHMTVLLITATAVAAAIGIATWFKKKGAGVVSTTTPTLAVNQPDTFPVKAAPTTTSAAATKIFSSSMLKD